MDAELDFSYCLCNFTNSTKPLAFKAGGGRNAGRERKLLTKRPEDTGRRRRAVEAPGITLGSGWAKGRGK